MESNKNTTINNAAQARLEKIKRKTCSPLVKAYGGEKDQQYLDEVGPRLDNDVFPIIFPHPLTEQSIPDVDFLVTIGEPNLLKLRSIQRKHISALNKDIQNLQRFLDSVPQETNDIPLDNRPCDVSALSKERKLEICEGCPLCQKYHTSLLIKSMGKMLKALGTDMTGFTESYAEDISPHKETCLLFDSSPNKAQEREQIIAKANERIQALRQEKRARIAYIDRLTAALHNKSTLPRLPIFADLRSGDYLKKDDIVCLFLGKAASSKKEHPTELAAYFCHINSTAQVKGAKSGEDAVYINSVGNAIMSGEVYMDINCTANDILKHGVDDAHLNVQHIPEIDPRTPYILKIDELLELKQNPEYAKIWVYSNFHSWHTKPMDIEPLLAAINDLVDNTDKL